MLPTEHYSSKHCDLCGGEGDGFKCPKCGKISPIFDSSHSLKCEEKTMMQVRCKACGEAEKNCKCK